MRINARVRLQVWKVCLVMQGHASRWESVGWGTLARACTSGRFCHTAPVCWLRAATHWSQAIPTDGEREKRVMGGGGLRLLQRVGVCQRCYLTYLRKDQQRLMSHLVDDDQLGLYDGERAGYV
jgi:hypothetical protein